MLPPKALKGRDDEIEIPVNAGIAHLRHLDGVSDGVKDADRVLVCAVLFIRIALASNGNIVHRGNFNDLGFALGQVEFLVFLFEVECHGPSLSAIEEGALRTDAHGNGKNLLNTFTK